MSTINLFMLISETDFITTTHMLESDPNYYLTYYFVNFLAWFLIYMILYVIARIIGNLKKRVY